MSKTVRFRYVYHAGLLIIALLVFPYIFNSKLDLNGDNCHYYINASSLASGAGYCDMYGEPTANFPPGYPLLMTPLRFFTSSFVAQKILNLVFLFLGTLLLHSILLREGVRREIAFIISVAVLTTPHLLEFSTMMMSEASCFFFIALAIWSYLHLPPSDGGIWRSRYLYVFLFAVVFSFYIRVQAIALVAAFVVALLVARRWRLSLSIVVTFALGYAPWVVRNVLLGLGRSRYFDQISFTSLGSKLKMLLVQALPESIVPYFDVNYMQTPSLMLWVIAAIMLSLAVCGLWQLRSIRVVLYLFVSGSIGIVAIMDSPSLYRYLVILLPVITAAFIVGVWKILLNVWRMCTKRILSPWVLIVLLLPGFVHGGNSLFKHSLNDLHESNKSDYPPLFINTFSIVRELAGMDNRVVIASRKPELIYLMEGVKGVPLIKFNGEEEAIRYLLDSKVDYLIVDDVALSVTGNNLVPFISNNKEIFIVESYMGNPDVFLFRFDREKASEWLGPRNTQSPNPSR